MTNNPTRSEGTRGSTPEFKPGDVAWHVRYGKVTLEPAIYPEWLRILVNGRAWDYCTPTGKQKHEDVGRVLYSFEEARQYGWLKEPTVVEFEVADCGLLVSDSKETGSVYVPEKYKKLLHRKRVHVTVKEIAE